MAESISLKELLQTLKNRLSLIISITLIAVIISAVLSFFILTPIYQASTQLLVNQTQNNDSSLYNSNQVQTNLQLINTYNVIIKSPAILDKVKSELNLKLTEDKLNQKITVQSEKDSQVVTILVQDPDAKKAAAIANKTAEVFKSQIVSIMKVDNVNILAKATVTKSQTPIKPVTLLNIAIAFVIGIMAGVGLAFLLEFYNNTIKTEQDIERVLGLPVLGTITTFEDSKETESSLRKNSQMRRETVGSK